MAAGTDPRRRPDEAELFGEREDGAAKGQDTTIHQDKTRTSIRERQRTTGQHPATTGLSVCFQKGTGLASVGGHQ